MQLSVTDVWKIIFGDFAAEFRAFRRAECIEIGRKYIVNLVSTLQTPQKHRKFTFKDTQKSKCGS